MEIRLIEQHFAQLVEVWDKSKFNNYSDYNKQSYQKQLQSLFEALNEEANVIYQLQETELQERKSTIDFFFKSLEFLDSSTLNLLPFEIVYCLETALYEWVDDSPQQVIVTSLNNDINSFSFDPSLSADEYIYDLIKLRYKITFDARLVQINLPRYLSKDYLVNVVLYHELGHFVDDKYNISIRVHDDILFKIVSGSLKVGDPLYSELEVWFPYISKIDTSTLLGYLHNRNDNAILNHISEYFADLYAAQYISDCSSNYLDYLTNGDNNYSFSHPSTSNRNLLVRDFLNGKTNPFFDLLNTATKTITSRTLEKRFEIVPVDDIDKLIPIEVTSRNQIHYLFKLGWSKWIEYDRNFEKQNNFAYDLSSSQVYEIINSLIEKSIGNFIVIESWQKN